MSPWKQYVPNSLSLLRGVLSLIIGWLAFVEVSADIGTGLVVAAIITDKADGSLARWWRVESELGKKLESIIDPLFICMTVLYIVLQRDLPLWFVTIGVAAFMVISLVRVWVSLRQKELFYEKSLITKFAVGGCYVVMVWYTFGWQGREWLLWLLLGFGLVAAANYAKLLYRAARRV